MVSKQQNKCTLLCVGFVIGFVSGYSYRQLLLRSGDLPRSKQSFFEAKKKNKKSKKRHDRVPAEVEVEADPTNYFSTSY